MNRSPRRKPLWRWEAFLFALVLVLSIVASVVLRLDGGVLGAIAVVALLVVAVAAAALLVVPLLRAGGRDSENTRRSVEGLELVSLASAEGEKLRTVRVLESERRQTAIDAARAKSAGEPRGVLTPDASRWLGRNLRVAVDLVADDGTVSRAGFVPPELDPPLNAALAPLAERGAAAVVPVRIVGAERPFRVEILLPPMPDTSA